MGALEILMETRARKEIADQQNRTQQTNTLLDFALGQQKLSQDQRMLDVNQMLAQAKLQNAQTQSSLLQQFIGGSGGGNVPPGTKLSVGGLTIPLNRKYTDAESKALSSSESLQGQIQELINVVESDKGKGFKSSQVTGLIGPVGVTKEGQSYRLLKDSIAERLLRLRSGAQINESEYKRFIKMLPSVFRDDSLDIDQLKNFQTEFSNIEGRIKGGSSFSEKQTGGSSTSLQVGGNFQGKKILKVTKVK